jgi:hypothetical protein
LISGFRRAIPLIHENYCTEQRNRKNSHYGYPSNKKFMPS